MAIYMAIYGHIWSIYGHLHSPGSSAMAVSHLPSPAELLAIHFFVSNIHFSIIPRPKMVSKKVLAMVLAKYYGLQTLQNPANFQFFRRSIKSQVARPKAGPVTRPPVGGGGGGAGRRSGGSDRKRPGKKALFIEKCSFRTILTISGPSRCQKWIRLEISVLKMVEIPLSS